MSIIYSNLTANGYKSIKYLYISTMFSSYKKVKGFANINKVKLYFKSNHKLI